ncbi:MAG: sodium/solute symporter [Armatimonadetes bacterium]|nr:sodium/solute symporter [Armatimonadota bacterium]
MKLAGIDVGIFAIYILAVVVLGWLAARQAIGTKRDYFLAGDKLPWWMIGGSIIAANISTHHFVGCMGVAYARGMCAMNISWPAVLDGFGVLLVVFLPYYLRNGFYTMPEFLERRYGACCRTTYAVLILISYTLIEISSVLYLGAIVLNSLFGIPIMSGIIVLAVFTGTYTITGGFKAVVWTEMLQLGVLIMGGITLSILTIKAVGGWHGVMSTAPKWHLIMPAGDSDFPWTMFLGSEWCIGVFYSATNQFMVQRTLAAKNEWHARMGVVMACYLTVLLPLVYILPGVVAPILFPHLPRPDLVFPTLVQNILPKGLVGLVMAGLIAATMSHVSGAINSSTTIACVDIYIPYIKKDATDAQAVRFGKLIGIVIVLMGILWAGVMIAHSNKPVFLYLLNAYGYFTPGMTTMFVLGIFWKRMTKAAAMTVAIMTIPLSAAFELVFPGLSFFNRTGIVFWLCMLTAVIVSRYTTPKPESELEGLIWNKESLALPKELKHMSRGLRNPALWYGIIAVIVVLLYIRFH